MGSCGRGHVSIAHVNRRIPSLPWTAAERTSHVVSMLTWRVVMPSYLGLSLTFNNRHRKSCIVRYRRTWDVPEVPVFVWPLTALFRRFFGPVAAWWEAIREALIKKIQGLYVVRYSSGSPLSQQFYPRRCASILVPHSLLSLPQKKEYFIPTAYSP